MLGASTRIFSKYVHKDIWKMAFYGFLEIDKIGKTGESMKSYFSSIFMNIFGKDY
jgi:hypothetical protein